jgi:hypothetical protein
MANQIEKALTNRRSLEHVLAELEAKYEKNPSPDLARMMEQLRTEIEARKRRPLIKGVAGRIGPATSSIVTSALGRA